MTYSLITHDPGSNRFAVIVATCHLAVGAFVPHTKARVGAVATQGETNPLFGPRGLDLMASGLDANSALDQLLSEDSGHDFRQIHLMDASGQAAAWTGPRTASAANHRSENHVSVAGNFLTGKEVLDAVLDAWAQSTGLPWPERSLTAMRAGEIAGGDKRGRQSAALQIQGDEPYPDLDLRVDHSADPLTELETLIAETRKPYFLNFRQATPRLSDPGRTPESVTAAGQGDFFQERIKL